jgi:hypothetical protein
MSETDPGAIFELLHASCGVECTCYITSMTCLDSEYNDFYHFLVCKVEYNKDLLLSSKVFQVNIIAFPFEPYLFCDTNNS